MVISPFTRKHYVSHIPMDHTAVIKFVENRFIGPSAHLTARDAAQPNLLDFFDFTNPPWLTPPTPPTPVDPSGTCTPAQIWGRKFCTQHDLKCQLWRHRLSNSELFSVLFSLLLLVGLAQLLGYLFVRLRQPKVIGEILAGVVLGPALFGRLPYMAGLMKSADQGHILTFVYWLGLLLLMFLSGAETRELFSREERREVGWLAIVGTGVPFVLGLTFGSWLIRPAPCRSAWKSNFSHHHSRGRCRCHVGSCSLQDLRGP